MTYYNLSMHEQEPFRRLDNVSKHYPLIRRDGILRFEANPSMLLVISHINLNDLWATAQRGHWVTEDMRQIYRQMGYSLCGFMDVFGDKGEVL